MDTQYSDRSLRTQAMLPGPPNGFPAWSFTTPESDAAVGVGTGDGCTTISVGVFVSLQAVPRSAKEAATRRKQAGWTRRVVLMNFSYADVLLDRVVAESPLAAGLSRLDHRGVVRDFVDDEEGRGEGSAGRRARDDEPGAGDASGDTHVPDHAVDLRHAVGRHGVTL